MGLHSPSFQSRDVLLPPRLHLLLALPAQRHPPLQLSPLFTNCWPIKCLHPTISTERPLLGLAAENGPASNFLRLDLAPFCPLCPLPQRKGWRQLSAMTTLHTHTPPRPDVRNCLECAVLPVGGEERGEAGAVTLLSYVSADGVVIVVRASPFSICRVLRPRRGST